MKWWIFVIPVWNNNCVELVTWHSVKPMSVLFLIFWESDESLILLGPRRDQRELGQPQPQEDRVQGLWARGPALGHSHLQVQVITSNTSAYSTKSKRLRQLTKLTIRNGYWSLANGNVVSIKVRGKLPWAATAQILFYESHLDSANDQPLQGRNEEED